MLFFARQAGRQAGRQVKGDRSNNDDGEKKKGSCSNWHLQDTLEE